MDKVWFITGVSGGLGKSIAKAAAEQGNVVVGSLRNETQFQEFLDLVPGKTFPVLLDVRDLQQSKTAIDQIISTYGKIDVLVNNAGYGLVGAIEELSQEELRDQMEVNFFGALQLCQLVLPFMRKNRLGHIFNISSIAGLNGTNALGLYNASKFALEGFSEGMMLETKHLGIKVTIVEPGPFRTKWAGGGLIHAKKNIPDYESVTSVLRSRLEKVNGNQPGDPDRAAKLIVEVALTENPPLRLLLGASGYQVIESKLKRLTEELMTWKEKGIATDFDS